MGILQWDTERKVLYYMDDDGGSPLGSHPVTVQLPDETLRQYLIHKSLNEGNDNENN